MEKEFIPYDLYLDLKKLGFEEKCLSYPVSTKDASGRSWTSVLNAPLYQQVFRWFREKHDLDYAILPELNSGHKLLTRTYNVTLFMYNMNMNVQSEILRVNGEIARYIKREEAELACLKKLIEIIKI